MKTTRHFSKRMSQRGISRDMVSVVRQYGALDGNKVVLGRRAAGQAISELMTQLRTLKKIQDKGGLVIVEDGESLITTYNFSGRARQPGAGH